MAGPLRGLRRLPALLCGPPWQAPPKPRPLLLLGSWEGWALETPQVRTLATKKAKAKGKGQVRVNINTSLVEDIINLEEVNEEMNSVVKTLQENFNKTLSIRTNPGALDSITVTTKDGKFPLNQLAQISQHSAQLLVVNMSSFPENHPRTQGELGHGRQAAHPQGQGVSAQSAHWGRQPDEESQKHHVGRHHPTDREADSANDRRCHSRNGEAIGSQDEGAACLESLRGHHELLSSG
ncbi:ribosome-recycling factor, mitochondrial isoform X2 [Crotalus tigris]|uniref:ribosome-recycling factor, mitochondrial isoform X2 n=1 Tax=Crotalus tigris TaxID=88082 RepID=UPI00192FB295|nr:ribosome-recycling factor, mitochondrial isoform X2 [Crotalus tigris]